MDTNDFDFPGILTRLVAAVVILAVTWLIARAVKTLLSKHLTKVKALQRHDESGGTLGESLGSIAALVIWLFGLIAVLNLFDLTQVVTPIQDLLNGVLAALPGILGAAFIFVVGLVLARIVRQLVETALRSAGADRWLDRLSDQEGDTSAAAGATTGTTTGTAPKLSQIGGQLVFALIIIVVSISALQVLGIDAIAEPATRMLDLILRTIPLVIAAVLLLGIGYFVARLVAPLLESTLRGLGTDRALGELLSAADSSGDAGTAGAPAGTTRSPSAVIATIAQVAIMVFFAIAATRVLGFDEITQILDTVLQIGGSILLGTAIIAFGVLVANLIPRFVSGQAGEFIRYAAIALFVAIGLRSMGLADSIVNLAFGAVVVGAAAAAALAFGLGGRDAAARQLEQLQRSRESATGPGSGSADPLP